VSSGYLFVSPGCNGGDDLPGTRVVDHLQGVTRGTGEAGPGADDPAEENDAILVGDGRNGVDDLDRRRVAQQAAERRSRLVPSHAPESAGSRDTDVAVAVVGEIQQHLESGWPRSGAAAGISAHFWIGIPEQGEDGLDPAEPT